MATANCLGLRGIHGRVHPRKDLQGRLEGAQPRDGVTCGNDDPLRAFLSEEPQEGLHRLARAHPAQGLAAGLHEVLRRFLKAVDERRHGTGIPDAAQRAGRVGADRGVGIAQVADQRIHRFRGADPAEGPRGFLPDLVIGVVEPPDDVRHGEGTGAPLHGAQRTGHLCR